MGATSQIPRPYSAPDLYQHSLSPYQYAYSVVSLLKKLHCCMVYEQSLEGAMLVYKDLMACV
jgi:hypothetical protein